MSIFNWFRWKCFCGGKAVTEDGRCSKCSYFIYNAGISVLNNKKVDLLFDIILNERLNIISMAEIIQMRDKFNKKMFEINIKKNDKIRREILK